MSAEKVRAAILEWRGISYGALVRETFAVVDKTPSISTRTNESAAKTVRKPTTPFRNSYKPQRKAKREARPLA
jgi:hypothetical protein